MRPRKPKNLKRRLSCTEDSLSSTIFSSPLCSHFPLEALCGTSKILLKEMRDSSSILLPSISDRLRKNSPVALTSSVAPADYEWESSKIHNLQNRLERDGYVLLRNFLDREAVLNARRTILEQIQKEGYLAEGAEIDSAEIASGDRVLSLLNRQDIAHKPQVMNVLENARLSSLFRSLFREEAVTCQYKWLRAVPQGKFTGVHVDSVYMGRGCPSLLSVWIPLGDIDVEQGTLVVSPGSHRSRSLCQLRSSYGQSTVGKDGVQSGWLTSDPSELEVPWVSTNFRAGDICIIGIDLLHLSSTNTTSRFRLSCDTRWQPASAPMNPRLAIQIPKSVTP